MSSATVPALLARAARWIRHCHRDARASEQRMDRCLCQWRRSEVGQLALGVTEDA
jgi:hypothetical protein